MSGKNAAIVVAIFLVLLVIPVMIARFYYSINQTLTSQAINKEATITDLAANGIKLKLDNLVSLAFSMASTTDFSNAMAAGNWAKAIGIVRDLANNPTYYDPDVDRMVVYDTLGVQRAAYPELTGAIGTRGASDAWYYAIAGGKPFDIDHVIQRLSIPRIKVVNLAVPVIHKGATVGYLILQIPISNFLVFSNIVSLGAYGFSYVVDDQGNLVSDPHSSPEDGQPVNVAYLAPVHDALAGQEGTNVEFDPVNDETNLVSYKKIPLYGWGIVSQEPYNEAFGARNTILNLLILAMVSSFVIDLLVGYVVWQLLAGKLTVPSSPARSKKRGGFTLIELLVVVAIIAVLAVVVILSLNPAELLRQSRDSSRISDMATLKTAVSLYVADAASPNLASSSQGGYGACYLSTTAANGTSSAKCGVFANTYTVNGSTTTALYRKVDANGWIPVNFLQLSYGSPFGSLPIDPVNNSADYYAYAATSSGGYVFEINAFMESRKYTASGTNDVVSTDGGDNNAVYEVGNKSGFTL